MLRRKGYALLLLDTPERALAALREMTDGAAGAAVALGRRAARRHPLRRRSDRQFARRAAGAILRADDRRHPELVAVVTVAA